MIQLIHEMTYHLTAINTLSATEGSPHIVRQPWAIVEGSLEGPRIQAHLEGHGSDWIRLTADGYTRPDVRMQFRTSDGVTVLLRVTGLVEQTKAFQNANDSATSFEDQYLRISMEFETGTSSYAWLNTSLFIAEGRMLGTGRMEFEVYRVA
jgi:Protein of unknown function (DUF3237)